MASSLTVSKSPLLQQATDKYCGQYGAVKGFASRPFSLQELLGEMERLETEQRRLKSTKNCNLISRLEGLITFVERYAPAIDSLVQSCSGAMINPATLIWGLIRVLLEVVSSATRYFSKLLDLLSELSATVSIYSSYEKMFSEQPKFQQAVIEVYTDIIAILDKARQIFTQGKRRMLLRSLKTRFETEFRDNLVSIKQHLKTLESETTLAHRTEMQLFVTRSRAIEMQTCKESAESDIHTRLIRWLAPLDCDARLAEVNALRQAGSCCWVIDHSQYLSWKNGSGLPFLWISGPPGVGKSILSSALVADLRDAYPAPACVAVFHCDASDRLSRSVDVLFASLIAQMMTSIPQEHLVDGLPTCLTDAYRKAVRFGRLSFSKADAPVDIITAMVPLINRSWIIIDGLDELDEPECATRSLFNVSSKLGPAFRVITLSRNIPTASEAYANSPQIQIHASHVEHDILDYIEAKSKMLSLDHESARKKIVQAVNAKADGMFLWARLMMDNIATATCLADVDCMILQCPVGLGGMYDHFFKALASQPAYRQRLARDILQWLCCAFRPLTLSELEIALSTRVIDGRIGDGLKTFSSVIKEICGPFLLLSDTLDLLQPVHHSLQEYLLGPPNPHLSAEPASFFIKVDETHTDLALRCIRYVKSRPRYSELQVPTDSPDRFWIYAISNWCRHAVNGSYNEELECEILSLISTAEKRQHWLYLMLFGSHGCPFSLTSIFRLQTELSEWAKPSTRRLGLKSLTGREWNMDCLDLLVKAIYQRAGLGKLSNTYFETMMVARSLVRRLKRDNQLSEALARLERLQTAHEGFQSSTELGFVHNLIGLLRDQGGQVDLALKEHQMAHSIQETLNDEVEAYLLWTVNELGRMYRHVGLLDDSERMHRYALDQLSASLSEDHPEVIWTVNTLATTLRKQNQLDEALKLHLRAYNSRSKTLGELHAHTLWSCSDVAKSYRSLGDLTTALSWYRSVLDGRIDILGPEHPDTLWSMNHLGIILAELGRHLEALDI